MPVETPPPVLERQPAASCCRLEALPWDSDFFGFPVGALRGELSSLDTGQALLQVAARRGWRLVYWEPVRTDLTLSDLSTLQGVLVCRRANYARRPLRSSPLDPQIELVREADPALERLAVAAGHCSRFRRDPRLPKGTCERLYRPWLERSLAPSEDRAVFAAVDADGARAGLVAVSLQPGGHEGVVELLAVSDAHRRQGYGARLMAAAETWAAAQGAGALRVSTQVENHAACCLYFRLGYELASCHPVVHFWPLDRDLSPQAAP